MLYQVVIILPTGVTHVIVVSIDLVVMHVVAGDRRLIQMRSMRRRLRCLGLDWRRELIVRLNLIAITAHLSSCGCRRHLHLIRSRHAYLSLPAGSRRPRSCMLLHRGALLGARSCSSHLL